MSAPLAMALPPAAVISSTICCAGPASLPEPSTATPRSLTTTAAPSRARRLATDLPIPRPAPVTIATRSSRVPIRLTRPFRSEALSLCLTSSSPRPASAAATNGPPAALRHEPPAALQRGPPALPDEPPAAPRHEPPAALQRGHPALPDEPPAALRRGLPPPSVAGVWSVILE